MTQRKTERQRQSTLTEKRQADTEAYIKSREELIDQQWAKIDELQGQLASAQAEIEKLKKLHTDWQLDAGKLSFALIAGQDQLRARMERLAAAFDRYAQHDFNCEIKSYRPELCSCGLGELRTTLDGQPAPLSPPASFIAAISQQEDVPAEITQAINENFFELFGDSQPAVAGGEDTTTIPTAQLQSLKAIARATNVYINGGCCDDHDRQLWNAINDELLKWKDDGLTEFKLVAGGEAGVVADRDDLIDAAVVTLNEFKHHDRGDWERLHFGVTGGEHYLDDYDAIAVAEKLRRDGPSEYLSLGIEKPAPLPLSMRVESAERACEIFKASQHNGANNWRSYSIGDHKVVHGSAYGYEWRYTTDQAIKEAEKILRQAGEGGK